MTEPTPKILIIIPAFNEAQSIADVIDSIRHEMPEADIVVVNDGSSDDTGDVARALGTMVLEHPFNLGIGATMQTGYRYAWRNGYEIAVQVDGDGQHPAHQIKDIVGPVLKGEADMVVGSRFMGGGTYKPTLARGAGIKFFATLVSTILGQRLTDTTSGFRAASKRVIECFDSQYPDDYPEVEVLVLLHKKRYNIREIPVEMFERAGGKSSITPLRSVYYMVKVALAIFVELIRKV